MAGIKMPKDVLNQITNSISAARVKSASVHEKSQGEKSNQEANGKQRIAAYNHMQSLHRSLNVCSGRQLCMM